MSDRETPRSLTSVPGFTVGHGQDLEALTGCTVVLCPAGGARAAAVVRGMASSTRQFGASDPRHLVGRADAVLLAGGSAFGLDAAAGVMDHLRSRGEGFKTAYGAIPTVPTAILFDIGLGDPRAKPTPEMARAACEAASDEPVAEGCVGVGTGASVGKLLTVQCATKGGVGSASVGGPGGLVVGALAGVNAFGDVVDPDRRVIIAGARRGPDQLELIDTAKQLEAGVMQSTFDKHWGTNTTLVVVATNAKVPGEWLRRAAEWAADGLVSCLSPAFTAVDGDVLVMLASEEVEAEPHQVGLLAQRAVVEAVLRAISSAKPLGGLPASSQLSERSLGS
jgi:L-aminopeptidase/D-esterase-like protein